MLVGEIGEIYILLNIVKVDVFLIGFFDNF